MDRDGSVVYFSERRQPNQRTTRYGGGERRAWLILLSVRDVDSRHIYVFFCHVRLRDQARVRLEDCSEADGKGRIESS
jgi:hypothetical protein